MVSLDRVTSLLAQSLRAHRKSRGLSLGNLAEKAGVSKTSLSKIESMEGNPSLEVLCRIAHALNVPIGALLGESNRPDLQVIRKEDGQIVQSDSGLSIRPLHIEGRNHRTEVYELIVPPGAIYHSLAHTPGTEEFIICVEGDLRLGPKGQEVLLKTGDSIWFPADLPHAYESLTGARAVLFMRYPPAPGTPR